MGILDSVTTGPMAKKRRTFLYGPHGIGKTTWAAAWMNPIFICTEDGSQDLDVARTPLLKAAKDVVAAIREVKASEYDTLVLDSIDWLEKLIEKDLHDSNFNCAFGQGLIEVSRRIGGVLSLLDELIAAGKHVILLGHSHIRTVTRPDGTSWSRYEPKLSKHAVATVSEWCDEMLFADNQVVTQNKQVGMKSVSVGVDAGPRILHTVGTPAFEAKHRKVGLKHNYELADVSSYITDIA